MGQNYGQSRLSHACISVWTDGQGIGWSEGGMDYSPQPSGCWVGDDHCTWMLAYGSAWQRKVAADSQVEPMKERWTHWTDEEIFREEEGSK